MIQRKKHTQMSVLFSSINNHHFTPSRVWERDWFLLADFDGLSLLSLLSELLLAGFHAHAKTNQADADRGAGALEDHAGGGIECGKEDDASDECPCGELSERFHDDASKELVTAYPVA
jgi:hypothetical protein